MSWDRDLGGDARQLIAEATEHARSVVAGIARRSRGDQTRACLIGSWSAPGSPAASSPSGWRASATKRCCLIDRRPHIGGNAYDRYDEAGVLIHQYGPHIFHTNSAGDLRLPVAIHRHGGPTNTACSPRWTACRCRSRSTRHGQPPLRPVADLGRAGGLFAARAEPVAEIRTAEDVVVSTVGRELYEKFFRGYTRKQWGVDPSALDKAVTARVPTRTNPTTAISATSTSACPGPVTPGCSSGCSITRTSRSCSTPITARSSMRIAYRRVVFTGPIDEFFDYRYGRLPYRSLAVPPRHARQALASSRSPS